MQNLAISYSLNHLVPLIHATVTDITTTAVAFFPEGELGECRGFKLQTTTCRLVAEARSGREGGGIGSPSRPPGLY